MIGTSGPSSSTTALSIPQPASAAIRCSIVPTRIPSPFDSTVDKFDSHVLDQSARISAPASIRRNTIPASGGAGYIRIVTGLPQCSPIPRHAAAALNVRCGAIPMSPRMDNVTTAPIGREPSRQAGLPQLKHCYGLLHACRNLRRLPEGEPRPPFRGRKSRRLSRRRLLDAADRPDRHVVHVVGCAVGAPLVGLRFEDAVTLRA